MHCHEYWFHEIGYIIMTIYIQEDNRILSHDVRNFALPFTLGKSITGSPRARALSPRARSTRAIRVAR